MYLDLNRLRLFNKRVRLTPNFKEILAKNANDFQQNLLQEDSDTIEQLAAKINNRQLKNRLKEIPDEEIGIQGWVFGEKKVFCWTLIFCSYFQNVALQDLHRTSREEINGIFLRKHPFFIRYEMIRLLNRKLGKKVPWKETEVALFNELAHSATEEKDWKAISFTLFLRSSGQIYKSPNECREKWCNFLNPYLKRESWSLEEDLKLFQLVQRFGCRWAMISRELGESRTQHMVKNRVNLFYNNWKSKHRSSRKKGIFNIIYSYLKKRVSRLHSKSKSVTQSIPEGISDRERGQYDCLQYHRSNEVLTHNAFEPLELPPNILQFKQEKRTLDEEQFDPMHSDLHQLRQPSCKLLVSEQRQCLDLFCQDWSQSCQQLQYEVALRRVEDEVAKALGCSHFERLPNQQFQQQQSHEEKGFCWL